jgi:hypothetical protein
MFKSLKHTQQGNDNRLKNVRVQIGDHPPFICEVVVRFIAFIVDMPAANMLCGTFDNRSKGVKCHHHACNAGFADLDQPYKTQCTYNNADEMFQAMQEGNKAERRIRSVKKVEHHAFASFPVGNPKFNIFSGTPFESMHSLRQGTLKRVNQLLFQCLSVNGKEQLDVASRRFHRNHRQSVRKHFPRASFVNGITKLAKISAAENVGVLLTLCCLLQQEDVWTLFDTSLKKENLKVADVLELLECLLCFDA